MDQKSILGTIRSVRDPTRYKEMMLIRKPSHSFMLLPEIYVLKQAVVNTKNTANQ